MTIEIISVNMKQGIVTISAVDVSEERLQKLERMRDDGFERELEFIIDTHEKEAYRYLYSWLKRQKATKDCTTWGQALNAVCGTITTISKKYRSWD